MELFEVNVVALFTAATLQQTSSYCCMSKSSFCVVMWFLQIFMLFKSGLLYRVI